MGSVQTVMSDKSICAQCGHRAPLSYRRKEWPHGRVNCPACWKKYWYDKDTKRILKKQKQISERNEEGKDGSTEREHDNG
jgi:hypothetical protein